MKYKIQILIQTQSKIEIKASIQIQMMIISRQCWQQPYLIFVTGTTGSACVKNFVRCKIFSIEHENGLCILQMCKTVYDFHGVIKHLVCSFAYSMWFYTVILYWMGNVTQYIGILPQCIILHKPFDLFVLTRIQFCHK